MYAILLSLGYLAAMKVGPINLQFAAFVHPLALAEPEVATVFRFVLVNTGVSATNQMQVFSNTAECASH